MYHWHGMGDIPLLGGIGMVVWIVLLTGLVYLLARMWSRGGFGSPSPRDDNAREIARRRYARGDIDRQEYERIMEGLAKR